MKRIAYILLFLCFGTGLLLADDKPKPGLQIEDNTFFDPSRKDTPLEEYHFGVEWRIEAGFTQNWQRTHGISFPELYLNGVRIGGTVTFVLPLHFGIQTGLLYTLVYGSNEQHWRSTDAPSVQTEYIKHRVLEHSFTIPARVNYTIPLWKKLNLLFYTGPQLHIGLAENDYLQAHLSPANKKWMDGQGIPTEPYDRMKGELVRANIQWGIGAGLEWDQYRLQGGYDFGLNNRINHPQYKGQYMSEWGWNIAFCYRF